MSRLVSLGLQVGGFVVAIVFLAIGAMPRWAFVVAFGVHVVGDVLFLRAEGWFSKWPLT